MLVTISARGRERGTSRLPLACEREAFRNAAARERDRAFHIHVRGREAWRERVREGGKERVRVGVSE